MNLNGKNITSYKDLSVNSSETRENTLSSKIAIHFLTEFQQTTKHFRLTSSLCGYVRLQILVREENFFILSVFRAFQWPFFIWDNISKLTYVRDSIVKLAAKNSFVTRENVKQSAVLERIQTYIPQRLE